MTVRRVLGIGLDPHTVDFDTEFFRGKSLNADVIAGEIKAEGVRIRAIGQRLRGAADRRARRGGGGECGCPRRIGSAPVDVVVIGGGVRFDPAQTPMLEALVNVVIEAAPGVRIAFNTSPTDTAEAITRAS